MELRTLLLARNFAGLYYQYKECSQEFLGICVKQEWHQDVYDLTDPAVRNKLADMNVVCKVREKP